MNIPNPAQVASARTARLVAEGAHKPRLAYVSETGVVSAKASEAERRLISRAQDLACSEEFCHICKRPTDHWGEHTDEQILAWAKTPSLIQSLLFERFDV